MNLKGFDGRAPQACRLNKFEREKGMESFDTHVIGAGAIGNSVAFHLAGFVAKRLPVPERTQIGAGATSHSSGFLRMHQSVAQSVLMAKASWSIFNAFSNDLGDPDASAGMVDGGHVIAALEEPKISPLRKALESRRRQGIEVQYVDRKQSRGQLTIAQFDGAALIGCEHEAGFAYADLTATSFAHAARRLGVGII